jgi:threonine aldolase
MTKERFEFASDNTAGLCPEAWQVLQEANHGFYPSYGDDHWTSQAADALREVFEIDCDVYFVFNGTAANSLALASLCQSYHSVIAYESAHVITDECGAPEFFSNGTKLLLAPGEAGKILPTVVEQLITRRTDIHYPKPRVLSLTQPTEMGTIYQPHEVKALAELAHGLGLKVHMDGARFAQAVASLQVPPRALSWDAGVDVLCFGGTKLGMGFAEAVVFFDKTLAVDFAYRCKQAGQLASKMRFMAAPWSAMLRSGDWLRYAAHANAQAQHLAREVAKLPGVKVLHAVEANGVFVQMPEVVSQELLARGWRFYNFIGGGARFMCSWQTQTHHIEELLADWKAVS